MLEIIVGGSVLNGRKRRKSKSRKMVAFIVIVEQTLRDDDVVGGYKGNEFRGCPIIENGCAYTVDGDVYFSTDNFQLYGPLCGRKLEDNRAGERVAIDSRKRNPADFALWKVQNLHNSHYGYGYGYSCWENRLSHKCKSMEAI
ncbi:unnamed protein product [Ilex paraguariensis]|uniref:tRNA synthetases class I catalytic domain-containing protein n=1 Tax=Ilex paraguariensis TaxID=185542 RepID=A0ABC8S0I5_9AQUA